MKKTMREKKEARVRICINVVILLIASLLTYEYVIKDSFSEETNLTAPGELAEVVEENES